MDAFMLAQELPLGPIRRVQPRPLLRSPSQHVRGAASPGSSPSARSADGGPVLAHHDVDISGRAVGVIAAFNTGVFISLSTGPSGEFCPCEPSLVRSRNSRASKPPQLFNPRNLGPFLHDASAPTVEKAAEVLTLDRLQQSPGVAIGFIHHERPA